MTIDDLERFKEFIENRIRVKISDHKLPSNWRHTKQGEKNHKKYMNDAKGLLRRINGQIEYIKNNL